MTRAIGLGVFVMLVLVGVGLDWRGRRDASRGPSLNQAVEWLQARAAGKVALFVAWGFSGWHFFVR